MRWPAKETELDPPVRAWLEAQGLDVYAEVLGADLVGLRKGETTIVEMKRAFGVEVIAQALAHATRAHRTYVAVPAGGAHEALAICRALGIGVLYVNQEREDLKGAERVVEWETVKPRPAADDERIRRCCRASMRANTAGVKGGVERATPFKDTMRQVAETIAARPGITLAELVASVTHHYKTDKAARSAIASHITNDKRIVVRFEGGRLHLSPRATPS